MSIEATIWLIALAAALAVLAWYVIAVRFGHRWFYVGKCLAALAAALVVLVITWHFADDVLGWAGGDKGWAERGSVRALFIAAFTVLGGLWSYVIYRDRSE